MTSKLLRIAPTSIPLAATIFVCLGLYLATGLTFDNFFSLRVLVDLFGDNAFLGVVAVGMTLVILSGGIDLSVGAVLGASAIATASLIEHGHLHPSVAYAIVLALGTSFGAAMGGAIAFLRLPPFLVTLAGMFLARGIAFVISMESIAINHPAHRALARLAIPLSGSVPTNDAVALSGLAILYFLTLGIAICIAGHTRFGRHAHAIGNHEPSAHLMGVPIASTKITVYALSGLCASLAGVMFTIYTSSGSPDAGTTLELDAIAAVVIGGTPLSGGVGHVAGTAAGVLIMGIIQTAITFQGTLASWWTRIAIGGLLLAFILLQRLVQSRFTRISNNPIDA